MTTAQSELLVSKGGKIVNAAFLLLTTAWMAGADAAPAPVASSSSCCGASRCTTSCCDSCCGPTLVERLRDRLRSMRSCGCDTCCTTSCCTTSCCDPCCHEHPLKSLFSRFHHDDCCCTTSCCGSAPAPKVEPIGAPKDGIKKPLPEGPKETQEGAPAPF